MDGRQQRGAAIAAKGDAIGEGGFWLVRSQSKRLNYKVNPYAGECSCPDHQEMGVRCKHVWAASFAMTAETHADGSATASQRVTYSQDWTVYNRAQTEEKDTFVRLLADLCSGVPQPPQATGRPRLPLADMAFAATFKVFSRFSSRRFACDLRDAQERGLIVRAPHFNSVSSYMSNPDLTPILHRLIEASSLPLRAVERDFAVDSSGFSTCRFVRWLDHKHGRSIEGRRRTWIKAHVMVGVATNVVTAVQTSEWNESDSGYFEPLVRSTAERFQIAEVSADKAYLSRDNLALVEGVGGVPYVPFKSNTVPDIPLLPEHATAWSRMYHTFALRQDDFLRHYHKRSNVETTFSMVKGKFGDSVLSKSPVGQHNEVLAKLLAHNIVVVGQAALEFGLDPAFRAGQLTAQNLAS
jgi:transposase